MNAAKKTAAPLNKGNKIPITIANVSSPLESETDLAHAKLKILNIAYPIMMLPADDTTHWKIDGGSDEVLERRTRRYWVAMKQMIIGRRTTRGFQWFHMYMENMVKSAINKF